MKNARLRDILNLAVDLQSSSIGMTKKQMLENIKDRGYEISQRTLERWLFQLQDVGLEYEVTSVETDHGKANRYKVTGLPNAVKATINREKCIRTLCNHVKRYNNQRCFE